MTQPEQIVAVGLLTQRNLDRLGESLGKAYRIDEAPCLGELLSDIDQADRDFWRARDAALVDANAE